MTREISYDEIFYPGDLDTNNNDEEAREENETEIMREDTTIQSEECSRVNIKHKEGLDSVLEASPEIARRVEIVISQEREKKTKILVSMESENKQVKKQERNSMRKRKVTRRSPSYSEREKSISSRSRSKSPSWKKIRKYKKTPPRKRERSVSSSSRGTYDDFDFVLPEEDCPFACKECHRGFYTIKELSEHEVRAHDGRIPCALCEKNAISVTKLVAHTLFRHAATDAICHFCGEKFGGPVNKMSKSHWEEFRNHVYKEVLKKKMYDHTSKASGASADAVALRGVGRCPHGAAVKCKNFPNCPGAKCIYSHGQCRYDITCNKATCPFDHSNKPRLCMACVNDMKGERGNRRRYQSHTQV